MNKLKTYMGSGGEPSEGAILIFAHNIKEAKKVAWQSYSFIRDACDGDYINLRVTYIKNAPYLFDDGDKEQLAKSEAHIIECPTCCNDCGMWGVELDEKGYCESCASERTDE